jgi:hypothetical protein
MALKRISDLTVATTPLAGTELLELETAGGDARHCTAQDIADLAAAGGATLADGDYGDIVVSGSGTVLSIDANAVGTAEIADGAVTLAKQANMATASVVYRKTAGAGAPEVQTLATLKTDLGLTGTNSGDQTSIVGITGTIAQFNTACSDADFATGGGTATGTNTGDQTSIVGITGTKAQFDTACTDGDFAYQSDLTTYDTRGKTAQYVPAAAMSPNVTGGCAALTVIATASGQPDIKSLDFDASVQEYAQFMVVPPKRWNGGTVTFVPHWSHAATVTNFGVAWGLQGLAASDDDTIAAAFGTGATSVDTGGTTNDHYAGPESAAITLAGSPAKLDAVYFRVFRQVGNAGDTMTIDARLEGITLFWTTDASTDA